MRILCLVDGFWPDRAGGISKSVHTEMRWLGRRGVKIVVLSRRLDAASKSLEEGSDYDLYRYYSPLSRSPFYHLYPLVFSTVNKFSVMDPALDLGGGFDPAKGLGVFIPVGQVVGDRPFKTPDPVEAAAAYGLAGNQREPVFGSTRLSHEALVGVKCRWKRRSAVSHSCTAGCLWVP